MATYIVKHCGKYVTGPNSNDLSTCQKDARKFIDPIPHEAERRAIDWSNHWDALHLAGSDKCTHIVELTMKVERVSDKKLREMIDYWSSSASLTSALKELQSHRAGRSGT